MEIEVCCGKAEYKSGTNQEVGKIWQKEWDQGGRGRFFFFSVQSSVKGSVSMNLGGRDRVVITRLTLGHCAPNHGLAMTGEHADGECVCEEAETVNHYVNRYDVMHQISPRVNHRSFIEALAQWGAHQHCRLCDDIPSLH